jgi:DNA-binding transcriptional LysR family regulator
VLREAGLTRRVAAVVPSYLAAAFLILTTDLTGLIAGFAARPIAAATGARLYPVPAPLPPLPISAAWHARHDADPAHRWLCAQVRAIARDLAGPADPAGPGAPACPGGR